MLCFSGFKLYSRRVPLTKRFCVYSSSVKQCCTIGESRTISHAKDTQAQQMAPNPRPGRFSREPPQE